MGLSMKMRFSKLLALVLSLAMLLSMIPAVMAEGEVTEVATSDALVAALAAGGTIKLTDSFELTALATVSEGVTATLDLNGQTLTSNDAGTKYIANNGTLTITDSVGGGKFNATRKTALSGGRAHCVLNNGNLTVSGGELTTTANNLGGYVIYSPAGNVTVTGGKLTISQASAYTAQVISVMGNLTISGGTFVATSTSTSSGARASIVHLIKSASAQVTITGGDFTATMANSVAGASLVRGSGENTKASITVSGGTYEIGVKTASGGKGFVDGTIPVSVTGGTFTNTDGTALDISKYMPEGYTQSAEGTVSDGSELPEATEVATSEDFIAALEKGGNIRLTDSFELTALATVPAGVTAVLDLNGKTITSTNEKCYINNEGELTILDSRAGGKDGQIIMTPASESATVYGLYNTGKLTIEGGKITSTTKKKSVYVVFSEAPSVTINGGTFEATLDGNVDASAYAIAMRGDTSGSSVATINGGTFIATSKSMTGNNRCAAVYASGDNSKKITITINDGIFEGNREGHRGASAIRFKDNPCGATIVIKGGSFQAGSTTKTDVEDRMFAGSAGTLTITGGTFTYDSNIFTAARKATITGGTFVKFDGTKNDISAYLADDYSQMANGTVIKFETVEVATFEELVAALKKGGQVKLTAGFELTAKAEIPAGITVVLDLNGQTLTSNNGENYHLVNAGELTIIDSGENGTISVQSANKSANVIAVENNGTLTIEDGNFVATSGNRTAYALFSKGPSVIINGGTFDASFTKATGIYQAMTLGLGGTGSTVVINDCTVTATSVSERTDTRCAAVYVMNNSNVQVTINGGTYTATRTVGTNGASALRNENSDKAAKVTVNGGTYTATAGTDNIFDVKTGKLEITGGTFTYDGAVFAEDLATVTGGKFAKADGQVNDITACVSAGYAQLEDGSVVSATDLPDLVKVGEETYKTVWESAAKAGAGQTLTLLADAQTARTITLAEGVILDLNGYTLEAGGVFSSDSQIIDGAQAGLLKIPEGYAIFNTSNSALPVWDATAGGYRMADTKIQVKDGGNGKFYFRFDLTNTAWEALLPANDISLLVRVDGYTETYAAPQQWLDALYADTTGRGAIKVTFLNAPADMDIQVSVASNVVEISKGTNTPVLAAIGPSGTVDPLAADVREYLAAASDLYDDATVEELLELKSPKLNRQDLNASKQPVILTWKWDASIPADSQFTIQLSQSADLAQVENLACTHFNKNVFVQSEPFWNPMMGTTYYWRVVATLSNGSTVESEVMTFITAEGPRLMYVSGVENVRDLGGWKTSEIVLSDGTVLPAGTVKQGLVYRSALLEDRTAEGESVLVDEMGIKTEIELREPNASGAGDLANKVDSVQLVMGTTTAENGVGLINNPEGYDFYLRPFTKAENYPFIFHCHFGADRTGSLAFILNALQGVSLADLIKDYELTQDRVIQGSTNIKYRAFLTAFNALEGDTTYEKARTFCKSAGLTDTEIDTIILLMRGQ